MGNMHRILWFDEQVRYGKYPNSGHLSEHFEISVRQACRDIEYLTDTLCAPLVYNPKRRGYHYEDKTYVLPALILTASDIQMIQAINIPLGANGGFVWSDRVCGKSSWITAEYHFPLFL